MISEPFAKVLAAGRTQFNLRVTEARRRFPAFDPDAFSEFLQGEVDGLISAVADVMPDRVASVALTAYEMALELIGHGLAGPGARSPLVGQVWKSLAPKYAALIAENSVDVLGMLTNAAINLEKIPSTRPSQWIREMEVLAPLLASRPHLQAAGQILAWRAGAAHYRIGAIQAADQLPYALALTVCGFKSDLQWEHVRDALLADPWFAAQAANGTHSVGKEIGKFTGFGGEFSVPPQVRACAEGFFVKSAERYSFLIADAYGAVLHAATQEEFDQAKSYSVGKPPARKGSLLVIKRGEIELDLPEDQLALACNQHTVAVTSPYTHAIRLLPLQ